MSATEAMLASITASTIAQYSKPLKLWWHFCKERQASFFSPSVYLVLDFLSACLATSGSYSTLNTYHSAISLISSDAVGLHPLLTRFFKGVATLKPQRPRYDFIWDPSPVIARLAALYPHTDLSLEVMSKKLIILLALTTAQRMQTLAAIRCPNIVFSDSVVIKIPDRIKTSRIGKSQPLLIFKQFSDKPELCVFSLLKLYLELTRGLRSDTCDLLFISYRKPYKSVSSQTLGRWVKSMLDEAGIDVSIFSAYSIRHASTSFAASKGINIDEIRRTAGWSQSSDVFVRFYNRPIIKDASFQTMILNT